MTHLLHRQIRHAYPGAVTGRGMKLVDADGRSYIDACSGAAVSCLGHQDPEVLAAMRSQLDNLAYAHTSFFTSAAAEALGDELIARAPAGLSHVYLVSGGSEAVEAALKMARQYFVERGEPGRRHFIARRQSYHGNTLGALAVGGNAWRRAQFAPILIDGDYIDPCYEYRYRHAGETPEAYGQRSANALEMKIAELGADSVIAFVAETVVGATLGAVPPAPGYLTRIREICDRHGILLILDEVMCGMGRTGTLHACTQDHVAPDLMTVAKGLGGGYAPIGATFVGKKIFDSFANGSGMFQHGHTYVGHPLACAAALAVQRAIHERKLLANVQARGEQLRQALTRIRSSATYAAAACSWASSWSLIAARASLSMRICACMRRYARKQ
jgi:adenosylmethionine-8-amino-7-oxononanoate aminotransferase